MALGYKLTNTPQRRNKTYMQKGACKHIKLDRKMNSYKQIKRNKC